KMDNMPMHEEVVAFSKELEKLLPDHEIVTDHVPSRVVMFAKKKFKRNTKWHTWIDFPKYQELALSGKPFATEDYLKITPAPGLSGKGTLDRRREWEKIKLEKKMQKDKRYIMVDETTEEISFE
ncbi:MAG TPA: hypothetical protein VJJ52_05710, partial [Candidatus Nanoarchaeia archaeon]|nr:hypothetical protein [Candidatus Nanoarchaeia archaeon]